MKFVADACAAEIWQGDPETLVQNVGTDSRQAKPGDLFFAVKGERFDGHDFLADVAAKGATAVVLDRKKIPPSLPDCAVLVVEDARIAFGQLAAAYRRRFDLPVVCVSGSNGKTTTKELIASVLRQKLRTLWSEASFNNDIGVPATLLRLESSHQAAVLEAGTNHPGELAPLVHMIRPDFGVITNIGREHLEFFGDVAGVAREEGSLAELLPPTGTLFVNGDNEWTEKIAVRTKANVVRVGFGGENDWRAEKIRLDKNGTTFRVEWRLGDFGATDAPSSRPFPLVEEKVAEGRSRGIAGEYRINLLGRHQVTNALLALAVGAQLGLGPAEIQRGLAECQPAKMRLQFWEAGGVRVLDDAYNANADSTVAALETLTSLPLQGRRVAVLGDMGELGAHSAAAHAEVGRRVAELGIGQLFTIGQWSAHTARAARDAGLSRVIEFADVEAAVRAVRNFLKPGDVVLLKASRASRLERIAETLKVEK